MNNINLHTFEQTGTEFISGRKLPFHFILRTKQKNISKHLHHSNLSDRIIDVAGHVGLIIL